MVPQDHSIGEIQKGPITKVNQPVTPGIELQAFLVGVSVGGELYTAPGCLASRRASQKASMKRKVSPTEILNHCATQRRRSESNRRMEVLQFYLPGPPASLLLGHGSLPARHLSANAMGRSNQFLAGFNGHSGSANQAVDLIYEGA